MQGGTVFSWFPFLLRVAFALGLRFSISYFLLARYMIIFRRYYVQYKFELIHEILKYKAQTVGLPRL